MVTVPRKGLGAVSLLKCLIDAYGDKSNYESWEKHDGEVFFDMLPWIERDKGEYARYVVSLLEQVCADSSDPVYVSLQELLDAITLCDGES